MKNDPLLTMIIPAYNVEEYISQCLDSVVYQTVTCHRAIVVNDGSADGTGEICKRYAGEHGDIITYLEQDNRGQGAARNAALKMVNTPYVGFLDSDDWLDVRYVEKFTALLAEMAEMPDIVFTLPWRFDSVSRSILPWKDRELYNRIFKVNDDDRTHVVLNAGETPELYALEISPCRKIFKTELLRKCGFAFPEGLKWEDVPGHFELLHEAQSCVALPDSGFFYRINRPGQTTLNGSAIRLDLIGIFRSLIGIQDKFGFDQIERAYVIRVIVLYSMWSVDIADADITEALIEMLHEFICSLDDGDIRYYLDNLSENRGPEREFMEYMRDRDYRRLIDTDTRNEAIYPFDLPCHKRHFMTRCMRSVRNHGILYTAKVIVTKLRKTVTHGTNVENGAH